MKSLKARRILGNTLIYILLVVLSIIWLAPIVWLVLQSFSGEGIAAKEQLGRVHLTHALELRPNLSPVKHLVPALRGRSVRRVGQDHIDAAVRQGFHELKAVALIEFGTHERSPKCTAR